VPSAPGGASLSALKEGKSKNESNVTGVSDDRCGDAVGFSLSKRRRCKGRRQAERMDWELRAMREKTARLRAFQLARDATNQKTPGRKGAA
jgi:hypothetical protein